MPFKMALANLSLVFAGDPFSAYRMGAAQSRQVYQARLSAEADIVIADSDPYDSEFWLASKGFMHPSWLSKRGGRHRWSPLSEGVSPSHPEVLDSGIRHLRSGSKVQAGQIKKLSVAAHLVHVGRVIKERRRELWSPREYQRMSRNVSGSFTPRIPKRPLERAFALVGRNAKVAVLQRAVRFCGAKGNVASTFHADEGEAPRLREAVS